MSGNSSINFTSFANLTDASWGCMSPINTVNCTRHSVVTGFALVTLLLVAYKLFFFHYRRHSAWHQFVIFYAAAVQLILLFVHWMLVQQVELSFVALFFKSIQALTVVYFYCSLAAHQLRQEKVFSWVFVPVLGLIFAYFIAAMIYALATTVGDHDECYDLSWILFACGESALSFVFLLAGVQITRKINAIRMATSSRRSQKLGLWLLIAAFSVSSICGLTVDVYALTDRSTACERILGERDGPADTARYICVRALRYLLPVWAMIVVFRVPDASQDGASEQDHEPQDSPYRPVNDYYGSVSALPGSTPTDESRGLLGNNTPNGSFTQFPPNYTHSPSPGY